jgi:protein TonB
MLENFTKKQTGRGILLWKILALSLVVHGIFITAIILFDSLRVDAVPQPPLAITFVDYASLPPPPPPPPPPKKKSSPKQEQKTQQIKPQTKSVELVAPKNIPEEKPREPQEPEPSSDNGDEDGVDGGVVGGVVGGIIGGALNAPPQPPPSPLQPTYQTPDIIKKRRIAGREPEYPRIARLAGIESLIVVKIYITSEGAVGEIQFLKSDPNFDQAVRDAIKTWKFTPHTINGTPVGTYTVYKFVFKLE